MDNGDCVYKIFSMLINSIPNANIDTLKQISIYIENTTDDKFDINYDCQLSKCYFQDSVYFNVLSLFDGRKIYFFDSSSCFGFIVTSFDLDSRVIMNSIVSQSIKGDMSTISVYSKVNVVDEGMYVLSFRPNNIDTNTLKFGTINYYTIDEINWISEVSEKNIDYNLDIIAKENEIYPFAEKSYFDISIEDKTEIDSFCGCITSALSRADLLFNNVKNIKKNKLVFRRK